MRPTTNATTTMPMPWYFDDEDMPSDAESMLDEQCYAMAIEAEEAMGQRYHGV